MAYNCFFNLHAFDTRPRRHFDRHTGCVSISSLVSITSIQMFMEVVTIFSKSNTKSI